MVSLRSRGIARGLCGLCLATSAAVFLGLGGCGMPQAQSAGDGAPAGQRAALRGTWVLSEIGTQTAPVDPPITASFGEDGIAGSAGCNQYSARLTYSSAATFQVGPISRTKKACPGTIMQWEELYLDALSRAFRHAIEQDQLVVSWEGGGTGSPGRLVFRRARSGEVG